MINYKKVDGSYSLSGKTAFITGAADGIGFATAEMMASKGVGLILADRQDRVAQVAEDLAKAHGVKAVGCVCDVTDMAMVDAAIQKGLQAFGSIDFLCNIAGIALLEEAELLPEDYWDRVMDINAKSVFMLTQRVGRHMIKNGGGKIVNMASQAGVVALDRHVAYCASKAAVISMTKVIAGEWAEFGINVNAVSPTVVLTELGEKAWAGQVGEDMKRSIPAGRFAYPDEIAAAVCFLCCDEANMITGENLVVDGGYTIK